MRRDRREWEAKRCDVCDKRSYRTEAAAMRVVNDGGGIRAYPCPHDYGKWHTTSQHIGAPPKNPKYRNRA